MRDVPAEVIDDINAFRYQEAFHLSSEQMDAEPKEAIDRAVLIWNLDAEAQEIKNATKR